MFQAVKRLSDEWTMMAASDPSGINIWSTIINTPHVDCLRKTFGSLSDEDFMAMGICGAVL